MIQIKICCQDEQRTQFLSITLAHISRGLALGSSHKHHFLWIFMGKLSRVLYIEISPQAVTQPNYKVKEGLVL